MRKIKAILKALLPSVLLDIIATRSICQGVNKGHYVKLYRPYRIYDAIIGDYTYISMGAYISQTTIGKFCSIGPNFFCGFGIHPTTGVSTSPMFYSTLRQNGITLALTDKYEERKRITIGNDVFIGANVTILDGVTIGDGAIVGAGAVVVKDVEPYMIVGGVPATIIRPRFPQKIIEKMLACEWWKWSPSDLCNVEKNFSDVDSFLRQIDKEV